MNTFRLSRLLVPAIIVLFCLASCKRTTEPVDPSIPDALQNDVSTSEVYGKRKAYNDLVNEMFEEILEKRPEVKAIVDSQATMLQSINDIQTNLHKSDGKSSQYYSAARQHANSITDSTLRHVTLVSIDKSEARWKTSLVKRDLLDDRLSQARAELVDGLHVLKIRLTLPQIEDYQVKTSPSLAEGNTILQKQAALLQQMQQLRSSN